MQIDRKEYNPEQHDMYTALTVKQPYADLLTNVVSVDESGNYRAEKTIEVRSRNTKFRGDLLICSSAKPFSFVHPCGVTCGFVELYDTKPVEDFTPEDWAATCIPEKDRPRKGFGWLMRNPRRVVEMPVKGQLGFYSIVVLKGDLSEYPRNVKIGSDGWRLIQKKLNK